MIVEEEAIPLIVIDYFIGEDIDESFDICIKGSGVTVQLKSCVICPDDFTKFNYTYYQGQIKMKEDKRHAEVILDFTTGNNRLSLSSVGVVTLTMSRVDALSKLSAAGARNYFGDLVVLNQNTNIKVQHANIIFNVKESASA